MEHRPHRDTERHLYQTFFQHSKYNATLGCCIGGRRGNVATTKNVSFDGDFYKYLIINFFTISCPNTDKFL